MKFDVASVFEQLVNSFVRLPLAQKVALPLLMVGAVSFIVFVSRWASRPDYGLLFSNLEEADAASIVEQLKEKKINFRLRDNGKTVDVSPPDAVDELRLEFAATGYPKGRSVGFELFNDIPLGQTAFAERIKLIRSIQGELERTVASIDAVRNVRIHITYPEPSVFLKRDVKPTASVLLKLKSGSELTEKQIKGIANLVAGSVERLTPENVSIMDSTGALLNEKKEDEEGIGAQSTRLEYQRQVEGLYVKRIESMLTEVLGPGRAVARVTAELDFTKFEREEEAYDPAGSVTRSERAVEEAQGVTADGGVPGVVTNLTNDPALLTPPDSAKNNNRRRESTRNYELSRAVSKSTNVPGSVTRLSVAVLVDGQHMAQPGAAPDAAKSYQPLAPEMLRKIDNLVKKAVGFDESRGDVVTVENMQFADASSELAKVLEDSETRLLIETVGWIIGPVIIAALFFLVVVKPLVRFLVSPSEAEVDLSRLLPAGIEELEAELDAERSKLSTVSEMVPTINIEELGEILSENSRIVRENPQQAALLIRYWLNDGRV